MVLFKEFTAYLDASGHPNQPGKSKAYFLVGFVASVTKWKRFENDWPALLEKHRIPVDPEPFHMTEFMAREKVQNQYTGWDGDQDAFIVDAGKLIKKHTQKPFASGVVIPHLRKMHETFVTPPNEPKEPLVWCGHRVFQRLIAWAHNRYKAGDVQSTDKIQILVEGGEKDAGAYFAEVDRLIRWKPIAQFDRRRSRVSLEADQAFRWKPISVRGAGTGSG